MIQKITSFFIVAAFLVACSKNALTGKSQLTLLPEAELQTMATGEYILFLNPDTIIPDFSFYQ